MVLQSDEFNGTNLNTLIWTTVNPKNDATFTINNGVLEIYVPPGTVHDAWKPNNGPRVMQAVQNTDFDIKVKFNSIPGLTHQSQGIIIEQDASNYIRTDIFKNDSGIHFFFANLTSTLYDGVVDTIIPSVPGYIRVTRVGEQYTVKYSSDNITWITGKVYNRPTPLLVSRIGPFAGNYNIIPANAPAFTAQIDSFIDMNAPRIYSDEFSGTTLDTSIWTAVDPRANSIFSVSNGALNITVPYGSSHDAWMPNNSARVMQNTLDRDFDVQVKFTSQPSQAFQEQGIIIEQDANNFTRFDFYNDGINTQFFATDFINGVNIGSSSIIVPLSPSYLIRVSRIAGQWTARYSLDEIKWITAHSYVRTVPLIVSKIGPFIGNMSLIESQSPEFIGKIEYFRNMLGVCIRLSTTMEMVL